MMLTILTTTDRKHEIDEIIRSVDRLNELVTVSTSETDDINTIIHQNDQLIKPLDWFDFHPPITLSSVEFSTSNLLALVFFSLGNEQRAFEYLSNDSTLYTELLISTSIQFGYEISEEDYNKIADSKHNAVIVQHYGNYVNRLSLGQIFEQYEDAIETAPHDEMKAFTSRQYINLLIDLNELEKAEGIAREVLKTELSEVAKNAIKVQLAAAMKEQLTIPFDSTQLEQTLSTLQEVISFYESKQLKIQAGLLLIDASEVANYLEDFVASKDYINKAILYFKQENVPEFLGEASLRKATLLYTWSKNGQPQYYKAAINAFQDTLKVFKKETHPDKFAEIHHTMALIYSEIPVSPEEKPMWTAFCASSFKEALSYFTKENYPYEHAMVSHNYATALINFPEAKLHSNFDKAHELFNEALTVRTASEYPFERASTLINQLELYWLLNNENKEEEVMKIQEMKAKLEEIKQLTDNPSILEKVAFHEENLQSLKTVL